jgi:antitoxin VapB
MTVAKVFMNGRSQAIRLPKDFRVRGREVYLRKMAGGFLVVERDPWEVCCDACRELSDDFADALEKRKRSPNQKRNWRGVFE